MTHGAVDITETQRFIDALDPTGLGICWQTFDDNYDRKDRSLARTLHGPLSNDVLADELHRLQGDGAGVFITVNAIPDGERRLQANVVAVRALFIDHDVKDGELRKQFALPPSAVIRSGGGKHYYWLLRPDEPVDEWRSAQCVLIDYYGSDRACKDLSRVMRAPGWIHQKNDDKPIVVEIESLDADARYSIADVVKAHQNKDDASPTAVDRCRAYMRTVDPAVKGSGTGHHDTYRACQIGGDFGLSDEEFWPILRDWGATCTPPWDDGELRKMMEDSTKYRKQPTGCRLDDRPLRDMPQRAPEEKRTALDTLGKEIASGTMSPEDACDWVVAHVSSAFEREACIRLIATSYGVSVSVARREIESRTRHPSKMDDKVQYGLSLPPMWEINKNGVFKRRPTKDGWCVDESSPVAPRPIWPSELGTDLVAGDEWVQISWLTAHGIRHDKWLRSTDMCDRGVLTSLKGAPVSLGRVNSVSDWLIAASGCIKAPPSSLLSSSGWVDGDLILRSSDTVRYVGPRPLCNPGSVPLWMDGIKVLLDMELHTAMACMCLSFASPMVRWLGRRCPVLGLVHESSRGKGTAIDYALSLWTNPADLTAPAGSSMKGIQDMGTEQPDLPMFADDIHQLAAQNKQDLTSMMYYLGNGQRRVTSSQSQESVGGERRYGTAFYASEYQVLGSLPTGVVRRCIELHDAPMPGKHAAARVKDATLHAGAMCDSVVSAYNAMDRMKEIAKIAEWKNEIRECEDLDGDDVEVLALLAWASDGLQVAIGAEWETRPILQHVSEQLSTWRRSAADTVEIALCDLVTMVMSMSGGGDVGEGFEYLEFDDKPMAWRKITDSVAERIDVVMTHPMIQAALRQHNIDHDMLLRSWASRGWLVIGDVRGRPYTYRKVGSRSVRVVRINAAGCSVAYGKHEAF